MAFLLFMSLGVVQHSQLLWRRLPLGRHKFPNVIFECSMVRGSPFVVRQIPPRPTKEGQHLWRMGVRLGPVASGEGAKSLQTPPPAARRVGVRGILDVLSAPGQPGHPTRATP